MTRYTHADLDLMYKSFYGNQRTAHEVHTTFLGDIGFLDS